MKGVGLSGHLVKSLEGSLSLEDRGGLEHENHKHLDKKIRHDDKEVGVGGMLDGGAYVSTSNTGTETAGLRVQRARKLLDRMLQR